MYDSYLGIFEKKKSEIVLLLDRMIVIISLFYYYVGNTFYKLTLCVLFDRIKV